MLPGTALLLAPAIFVSTAQGYDAAADYSPGSNPGGVWSYGYSLTLGSPLILHTDHFRSSGVDLWRTNFGLGDPAVFHNPEASPLSFGTITLQAGELGLHPGPQNQLQIVRFTAPSAGAYRVSGSFSGRDVVGTTTDVHLLAGGISVFDGAVTGFGPDSGPSFDEIVTLPAGGFLDFAVGFGANNDFFFDTTALAARIVPVPALPLPPTTIYFDQLNYSVPQGAVVSGSVKIAPLPPGGLYSQGTRITIHNLTGDYAGYITPVPSAKLDFDGLLLAAGSRHAPNTGLVGVKGSASFIDVLRPLELTENIATFTVGALPAGDYTMELSAWNDLGPTENIFVTGDCRTLDSVLTFRPSFIAVESADPLASLAVCNVSGPEFDLPSGLIKQVIRVTNKGSSAANSFRVFVQSLPADVTLSNRSGIIDGVPYIDFLQPLAAGAGVNLTLEYLRENGQSDFTPAFRIPTIQTLQNPNPAGVSNLNLRVVQKTGSGALLEFASGTGRLYTLEYTDDFTTWKVSQPVIQGNGAKIQWLDNGLPKTATFPGLKRFYRITTPFCP